MIRRFLIKKDLERLHFKFNQLYFGGSLSKPTFKWITCSLPYGRYIASDNLIQISVTAKRWTEEVLRDTLIHEMIHQYVYERMWGFRYSLVQHGIQFYFMRWQLKKKYGLHISGGSII